jgi:ubiquinone/menaquinone biosynthesis C-methylase UbiE
MTAGKSESVAAYYDKAATLVPELTVLNYGYSSEPELTSIPRDDAEFYCLRLYEHTVRDAPLAGAEVLEVSCGRGGGASYLTRALEPKRYLGIDLSEENLRLAVARNDGPEFMLGNAEQLELADASFDVVINIEASHLYDDRRRFFAEVFRVLRPGAFFCYADGCWADDDCSADLLGAGFALHERLEITPNVISALEKDSARRERLFDAMASSRAQREEYKDWGGVVGYRAYRRFVDGQTLYFSHLLTRPA